VLTVRTSEGDFVLDNLDERILPWNETDYLYLKRQSELDSGKWIGIADDRDILVGSVR
ncbi:MAG: transglutaminase-like cysteine peptidase, partial [Aurantimonas coralicida]